MKNSSVFVSAQVLGAALLWMLCLPACTGDTGPAGPAGSPGPGGVAVKFTSSEPPVVRADGASTVPLTVVVSTAAGNYVEGVEVRFGIVSGAGSVAPSRVTTNAVGEASCTYTAGDQPGTVRVFAQIEQSNLALSDVLDLYVDAVQVSTGLLPEESPVALMASFNPDGTRIVYQSSDYTDYALSVLDVSTRAVKYLGPYRGGAWAPDGSNRIAAFTAPTSSYSSDDGFVILDDDGNVLAGPTRPPGFFGTMRAISWCCTADTLAIASNTNALMFVTDVSGTYHRGFEMPIFAHTISPLINTPNVVVSGGGEWASGVYVVDLRTESARQLVAGDSYYVSEKRIMGASVSPAGNEVVFSVRQREGGEYNDQNDLLGIPFEGGPQSVILASPVDELYPSRSLDWMVFSSNRSRTGFNLYAMYVGPPPVP